MSSFYRIFGKIESSESNDRSLNHGRRSSLSWRRRLRVGEKEQLDLLFKEIAELERNCDSKDDFYWLGKLNNFKARDISLLIQQHSASQIIHLRGNLSFTSIWKWRLPPRIQFFTWLVVRNRIFSNASLVSRGILSRNQIGCSACGWEETSIHIICHCSFAWKFWCLILNKCDIVWVPPPSIDLFFDLWTSLSNSSHKDLWRLVWFFGIWGLWKARNDRVFNDLEVSYESLAYSCICKAVQFFIAFHPHFPYSGNNVFRCLDNFVVP
ncbi:uncharacterized protein LOC126660569 [Mercurialis annua]|uniref:uncharacterized protein LOC126660569 n=1 Tax=Mercurialis annua TaxID=3986 RepID=UPI00215FA8DD|nr:uncharacterized protein LOC126660569 [Mercurialis annua]